MLRGYLLALLLLAGARYVAAQQPASPTSAKTSAQTPSQAPSSSPQPCGQPPLAQPPTSAWHCITVNFNYNFSTTPACSANNSVHPCTAQFAIYETTAGTGATTRIFLFNVPLPAKQSGVVSVTMQSPRQINWGLGWHKLGVAALDPVGGQSNLRFCNSCATWVCVQVGPTPIPSVPAPGTSTMPPATPPCPSTPPTP